MCLYFGCSVFALFRIFTDFLPLLLLISEQSVSYAWKCVRKLLLYKVAASVVTPWCHSFTYNYVLI